MVFYFSLIMTVFVHRRLLYCSFFLWNKYLLLRLWYVCVCVCVPSMLTLHRPNWKTFSFPCCWHLLFFLSTNEGKIFFFHEIGKALVCLALIIFRLCSIFIFFFSFALVYLSHFICNHYLLIKNIWWCYNNYNNSSYSIQSCCHYRR